MDFAWIEQYKKIWRDNLGFDVEIKEDILKTRATTVAESGLAYGKKIIFFIVKIILNKKKENIVGLVDFLRMTQSIV